MNLGKYKLYRRLVSLKTYLHPGFFKAVKVAYFDSPNFGDALNPILLKMLGVNHTAHVPTEFYHQNNLMCIGSMLQVANKGTQVWGSGFISQNTGFYYAPPKKVLAVRGPRTRQKLLKMNINCPEVYGDPALLLPFLYQPKIEKKYKIGIVPHYTNKNDRWLTSLSNHPEVKIIDVMNPQTLQTLDEILSCELILSSSLHGIILADAYQIPAYWIKFKQQVGLVDFKFYDYFNSVNRHNEKAFLTENNTLEQIITNLYDYDFQFDHKPLVNAFPFEINEQLKTNFGI